MRYDSNPIIHCFSVYNAEISFSILIENLFIKILFHNISISYQNHI